MNKMNTTKKLRTITITEKQHGLLFKNGKFAKVLEAGRYTLFGGKTIEVLDNSNFVFSQSCPIDTLLSNEEAASKLAYIEVPEMHFALHYVNGQYSGILLNGRYAFWAVTDKHEFNLIDISDPEIGEDVPCSVLKNASSRYVSRFSVADYEKGRLYIDQRLVKVLEPGTYYFWNNGSDISVETVDTRRCTMEVKGQSVLTKDKVEVRITFMLSYKITDCVKVVSEIDDFRIQLYTAAQLTLRELAGRYKMDELLDNREQLSADASELMRQKAASLYVEIVDAGIRDIILPGEISCIMNTVLAAEKRAQANVITRREEVASTRSLLNTAKLMDENKTLYKLKELEYIEKICENVGSISVDAGKGLLSQLTTILADN